MVDAADYGWLADYDYRQTRLAGSGCVTVVRGLDVPDVVLAFGGDPSAEPESVEELLEEDGGFDELIGQVAVGPVGDVVVAVEVGGFAGSRPEVLRPASAGGLAVSVHWNRDAGHDKFTYAEAGQVVTSFEPLFPDNRDGADPDRLAAEIAEIGFGLDRPKIPAAFALMERVTGVHLSRDDVHGVDDLWRPVPPVADHHPAPPPGAHGLSFKDAELVRLIAAAAPERQRTVAQLVAGRFERAANGEGGVAAHAARIVHVATNPDPLAAALDAVFYASIPVPDPQLFAEVRRLLLTD